MISKPRLFHLKASCKGDIIMRSRFIEMVCAMKGLTLMALLLCSSSKYPCWLSMLSCRCRFDALPFLSGGIVVADSDPQIVEVQLYDNVTLHCANISTSVTLAQWFRVVNRTKPSCVSSMFDPHHRESHGFVHAKFEMTSNISHLFLRINRVDFSDAGLYFCGFYMKACAAIPRATLLNVQGKIFLFFCLTSNKKHGSSDHLLFFIPSRWF